VVVDFEIRAAGRLIFPVKPRVEREFDRDSVIIPAAAEARRGAGTLVVLALNTSDALVLGRLAVLVDDDESELAPALDRGAMSDEVRVAAPGALPATPLPDLAKSSTRSELRRWILGSWLAVVPVAVRTDEVELSSPGSFEALDMLEMVEPAVVLLLLGIPDTDSESSLRLSPTGFSA